MYDWKTWILPAEDVCPMEAFDHRRLSNIYESGWNDDLNKTNVRVLVRGRGFWTIIDHKSFSLVELIGFRMCCA